MNRLPAVIAICTLLIALLVTPLAAQQVDEDATIYARSFYIHRIFPTRRGYRVQYFTDTGTPAETYLPIEWFSRAAGPASMVEGNHPSYPYMQVFWQNSEFSHMRLYVRSDYGHTSWGRWAAPEDVDELFEVDEPVLRL